MAIWLCSGQRDVGGNIIGYFLEASFKGEKAGPSPFLSSCYWEGSSDNWSCPLGSQRTSHTIGMKVFTQLSTVYLWIYFTCNRSRLLCRWSHCCLGFLLLQSNLILMDTIKGGSTAIELIDDGSPRERLGTGLSFPSLQIQVREPGLSQQNILNPWNAFLCLMDENRGAPGKWAWLEHVSQGWLVWDPSRGQIHGWNHPRAPNMGLWVRFAPPEF